MNFKYINRKQRLGISHPDDFIQWAGTLLVEREKEYEKNRIGKITQELVTLSDGNIPSLWEEFTPMQMEHTVQCFNVAIDALELDYQHGEVEKNKLAETAQFINAEARKLEIFFSIIDLRPISELGTNLTDIELLDKMVAECGCNPIGDYWLEYSPKDGRQTLEVLFEYDVLPIVPKNLMPSGDNGLANQLLNLFDDSVRFHGNSSFAPWDHKMGEKKVDQGKYLQSCHNSDFGLVLHDSKHIGFLLVTADYL